MHTVGNLKLVQCMHPVLYVVSESIYLCVIFSMSKPFEEYWSKEDVQRGLKMGDLIQVS